jgi:transcriptional regulator with XRE-family HTH domain
LFDLDFIAKFATSLSYNDPFFMDTLGKLLKQYREINKLTLRQVEEKTGISNAYLSQLENDKIAHPSANTLYKLSQTYDVEFETLLSAGGVIEKKEQSTPKHKILQSVAASAGTVLTDEEEKELLNYLNFIRQRDK